MLKKPKKFIKSIKDEVKSFVHQLKADLTHKKFKPVTVLSNRTRRHR